MKKTTSLKIGIISLGGKSSVAVAKACENYFEKVDMLDIKKFEVHLVNSGVKVSYDKRDLEDYDCLYIRGSYKYALLQRAITRALQKEVYMPTYHSAFTVGHDKFLTLLELQRNEIPIPKTYYAATTVLASKILEKEVTYPVIMKVPQGTHGKGVMVADSLSSAKTILDLLEEFKQPYIIQEFISTKEVADIRAIVCGDEVIGSYMRKAAKGELRTNVHSGGRRCEYQLTKEQERLAIESAKALKSEICGVDLFNGGKDSVNEVNLSPGLESAGDFLKKPIVENVAKYLHKRTISFKKKQKRKKHRKLVKSAKEFLKNQEKQKK